jgi:hypothetical protein
MSSKVGECKRWSGELFAATFEPCKIPLCPIYIKGRGHHYLLVPYKRARGYYPLVPYMGHHYPPSSLQRGSSLPLVPLHKGSSLPSCSLHMGVIITPCSLHIYGGHHYPLVPYIRGHHYSLVPFPRKGYLLSPCSLHGCMWSSMVIFC